MATPVVKLRRNLSSGYIKMKLKAIANKTVKKKEAEAYLKQMAVQREELKRSRANIEDTDDAIRFLKMEIEYLSS